jgi:putative peptidoglycan lipid II flippase
VRDIVLANSVGASAGADAFFVAFKIPNFLRRLFGEGAFAQAFVPVFSETREKDGEASVKRLIDQVAGRFGFISDGDQCARCAFGALDCDVVCPWVF